MSELGAEVLIRVTASNLCTQEDADKHKEGFGGVVRYLIEEEGLFGIMEHYEILEIRQREDTDG